MKYASAPAFREALERRLRDQARVAGSVSRLRKQVAFERFLRRLEEVEPGRWLLKGGFALELRLNERARATKDIDIDWDLGEDDVTEALLRAAGLDLGDFFEFRLVRSDIVPDAGARSQRWQATARLAGRVFEQVTVDVGCSVRPLLDPERLAAPALLAFAGLEPARVPAAALEQHLAEKLHAYSRRYAGNQRSSRVKDLVDIALISEIAHFDAARTRDAIARLYALRATQGVPASLPSPPHDWVSSYVDLARDVGLAEDLAATAAATAAFLNPLLAGSASGAWSPLSRTWGHEPPPQVAPGG